MTEEKVSHFTYLIINLPVCSVNFFNRFSNNPSLNVSTLVEGLVKPTEAQLLGC